MRNTFGRVGKVVTTAIATTLFDNVLLLFFFLEFFFFLFDFIHNDQINNSCNKFQQYNMMVNYLFRFCLHCWLNPLFVPMQRRTVAAHYPFFSGQTRYLGFETEVFVCRFGLSRSSCLAFDCFGYVEF